MTRYIHILAGLTENRILFLKRGVAISFELMGISPLHMQVSTALLNAKPCNSANMVLGMPILN